ncbi:hypothetical protein PINS_up006261 [Pythium insidiosum]|nr:hypothetical protein PINS_up006261 [Pythium insidiosum]
MEEILLAHREYIETCLRHVVEQTPKRELDAMLESLRSKLQVMQRSEPEFWTLNIVELLRNAVDQHATRDAADSQFLIDEPTTVTRAFELNVNDAISTKLWEEIATEVRGTLQEAVRQLESLLNQQNHHVGSKTEVDLDGNVQDPVSYSGHSSDVFVASDDNQLQRFWQQLQLATAATKSATPSHDLKSSPTHDNGSKANHSEPAVDDVSYEAITFDDLEFDARSCRRSAAKKVISFGLNKVTNLI